MVIKPETRKKLDRLNSSGRRRVRIVSRSDKEKDPQLRLLWGDHWVKVELARELTRIAVEVTDDEADVIIYFWGGTPKKTINREKFNIVWIYSHPDEVRPDRIEPFDAVFCASLPFSEKLRAWGIENVEFMPACTSKRPVRRQVLYPVIFLGNARISREDGRAAVADLMRTGADFKVWGNRWELLLPDRNIGGRYWPYENLEALYASAAITLNDHNHDMAREGFVSNKVFDIVAGGGFCISDQNPGVTSLFGDSVPQYESVEVLGELIDFFLKRPDERKKCQLEAREIAFRHSYKNRAERFLRMFSKAG